MNIAHAPKKLIRELNLLNIPYTTNEILKIKTFKRFNIYWITINAIDNSNERTSYLGEIPKKSYIKIGKILSNLNKLTKPPKPPKPPKPEPPRSITNPILELEL